MFSLLPDLTPRDVGRPPSPTGHPRPRRADNIPQSHALWYTSSRSPAPHTVSDPGALDPGQPPASSRRQNQAALERTAAARLRADEAYQERRHLNIANFGATWLRPPGVAKSLFQLREERREHDEHAEALRREAALAQQLADAEAAAAEAEAAAGGLGTGAVDGDGVGMDGDMMDAEADGDGGERDLDDDIPDAEGFGFDGADSDGGGDDVGEGEDDEGGEPTPRGVSSPPSAGFRAVNAALAGRTQRQQLQQMRATEDEAAAAAAARGWRGYYGGEEDDDDFLEDEEQAELLEEEDLVPEPAGAGLVEDGADMDMDADLDDDIPEADGEGYEHTDSEVSMSSDDGLPPQPFLRRPLLGPNRASGGPADRLSSGSSRLGSSPHLRGGRS